MRIGLTVQAGFEAQPGRLEGERSNFVLERARVRLSGFVISENLTFLLAGDLAAAAGIERRPGAPGAEVLPNGELDIPVLLDAIVTWSIPQIGLTVTGGRFIPSWGLSMGESVTRLGAIMYPLYVFGGIDSLGSFRTAGLELELAIVDQLSVGCGIYNGGRNTWLDENDRKDMLAFIAANPLPGFHINAASFFTFPDSVGAVDELGDALEGEQEIQIRPLLEMRYRDYGFDAMLGAAANFVLRDDEDIRSDYEAYGFLGHLGYTVLGDWLELMVRAEWWEPGNSVSDNEQWRITVGPQMIIEKVHARLDINYIQDIFAGERAMCAAYLNLEECDPATVPEAKSNASTVLIQLSLEL